MFSRSSSRPAFERYESPAHVDKDCPHLIINFDDNVADWIPLKPELELPEKEEFNALKWARLVVITLLTILIVYYFIKLIIWCINCIRLW